MKLEELNESLITEAELYEMARVKPANSGLPCIIFVSSKTYVAGRHGPGIKVSNVLGTFSANDNFVVSIAEQPQVVAGVPSFKQDIVNDVLDWVSLNKLPLLKYWEDQYEDDAQFYAELSRL